VKEGVTVCVPIFHCEAIAKSVEAAMRFDRLEVYRDTPARVRV